MLKTVSNKCVIKLHVSILHRSVFLSHCTTLAYSEVMSGVLLFKEYEFQQYQPYVPLKRFHTESVEIY